MRRYLKNVVDRDIMSACAAATDVLNVEGQEDCSVDPPLGTAEIAAELHQSTSLGLENLRRCKNMNGRVKKEIRVLGDSHTTLSKFDQQLAVQYLMQVGT